MDRWVVRVARHFENKCCPRLFRQLGECTVSGFFDGCSMEEVWYTVF